MGSKSHPRIRVAAYVVRQRETWELLVFEQAGEPHAGTQIPGGGVRPGEPLDEAVLREVSEETGLAGLRLRAQLVTDDKPHPTTGAPRSTTFFVVDAPPDSPDAWAHSVGGEDVDADMTFLCRWMALPLRLPLTDSQDAWLGMIDHRSPLPNAAASRKKH